MPIRFYEPGDFDNTILRKLLENQSYAIRNGTSPDAVYLRLDGTNSYTGSTIAGTGALGLTAGGVNQNITLTPSGTGATLTPVLGLGSIGVPNAILHVKSGTTSSFVASNTAALSSASGAGIAAYTFDTPTSADQRLGFYLLGSQGGLDTGGLNSAGIAAFSSAAWTVGVSHPSYLTFATTSVGSVSRVTRLQIASDGAVQIPSTNTAGIQLYNTADQTTNYERLEMLWESNTARIRFLPGGTGSARTLDIVHQSSGGVTAILRMNRTDAGGAFRFLSGNQSVASNFAVFGGTTYLNTSGASGFLSITPTYNQSSGTAANTDLLINRTETAVGSGAQYLIQAQVGGADRFWVRNVGQGYFSGTLSVGTTSGFAKLRLGGNNSGVAWGVSGAVLAADAATVTDTSTAGSGTAASAVFSSFAVPTLAATNASVTTTDAATLYIAGAPTAGSNQTITNPYALWIDSGRIRYDETASVAVAAPSTHKVPINIGGTLYYILLSNV